jgi:hypothetical protein
MIKEKKVLMPINQRNVTFYKSLGYNVDLGCKELEVLISDVKYGSKVKITAICEVCGSENSIMYSKYISNYERGGFNFYSCFGCKNVKKEMTSLNKWGVKSFSETDEFKKKYKKTCLEKYGVENPNMLSDFREKTKKTCLEKWGVCSPLLKEDVIESNRKWMSSDEFKSKSKLTLLNKWGVDSYSKTDEFKQKIFSQKDKIVEKMKKTFLERYGVEYVSQTDNWKSKYLSKLEEISNKKKMTCLERYGVENVSQVEHIYDKIIKSKVDNGQIIPIESISKWEIYKRKVKKITNKNKSNLYENWDGIDYYDGENILKYLSLSHSNRNYPTIDHKISLYFGFANNISPEIIGSIDNLCLTKRYINCMKGKLIEEEFEL